MSYTFMVQVVEDGEVSFSQKYDSAVEAVRVYDRFVDYGTCKLFREIVLVEANGRAHSKSFDAPRLATIR